MNEQTRHLLTLAKRSGIAHNGGPVGSEIVLCATEKQLAAFAEALLTTSRAGMEDRAETAGAVPLTKEQVLGMFRESGGAWPVLTGAIPLSELVAFANAARALAAAPTPPAGEAQARGFWKLCDDPTCAHRGMHHEFHPRDAAQAGKLEDDAS